MGANRVERLDQADIEIIDIWNMSRQELEKKFEKHHDYIKLEKVFNPDVAVRAHLDVQAAMTMLLIETDSEKPEEENDETDSDSSDTPLVTTASTSTKKKSVKKRRK